MNIELSTGRTNNTPKLQVLGSEPSEVNVDKLQERRVGSVSDYCPNCGKELLPVKCKMMCGCGFFLSCSDFY